MLVKVVVCRSWREQEAEDIVGLDTDKHAVSLVSSCVVSSCSFSCGVALRVLFRWTHVEVAQEKLDFVGNSCGTEITFTLK